jgi:hypothetical protein
MPVNSGMARASRRKFLLTAGFLLAGFIMSVTIALASLWWTPEPPRRMTQVGSARWLTAPPDWWPTSYQSLIEGRSALLFLRIEQQRVFRRAESDPPIGDYNLERFESGWPMRCLRVTGFNSMTPNQRLVTDAWIAHDIPFQSHYRLTSGLIPSQLAPIGIIVDSALFAGFLAALVLGPRALRTWSRQRHGRCIRCGYDRRGLSASSTCPECNAAAP